MPLLQVRECPEDIYRKISYIAKNENRTIAQQVVVLLEKSLERQESNIGPVFAAFADYGISEVKKHRVGFKIYPCTEIAFFIILDV